MFHTSQDVLGDRDISVEHHFLDVTEAEWEGVIQPDEAAPQNQQARANPSQLDNADLR